MLLCSSILVGIGETVEIHEAGPSTPAPAIGRILEKKSDPGLFIVTGTFDGYEALGREYNVDQRCIFRVLKKNLSGVKRRKMSKDEKIIVDIERDENTKERKVQRAKTGSVRRKKKQKK
jgi:hypothetical protein